MEKKAKYPGREIAGFFLLGLSLILLGRSVMLCFSNDIWYDELFTVGLAEHSYGELVRLTAADVHPPLYYCIVKFFADLCKLIAPGTGTVVPAKIVSVLPYFLLLLYAVTFMRKRFGLFVGGMFLFCVTAMPQLPAYTVEVRMYGWAMLFVTAAFLHAGELTRSYVNPKTAPADQEVGRQKRMRCLHGAAFTVYGLAAAYTQYFACVAVVMVYFWLLVAFWIRDRRRIREWLLCVAVSVICYVPWLFALAGQLSAVSENYWILPLTWRSLGGCVKFLLKPAFANETMNTILAVILFGSYLGLWCRWMEKLYYNRRVFKKNGENDGKNENTECSKKFENGEDGEYRAALQRAAHEAEERFWLAAAGIGVLAGLVVFGFAASFLIRPIFVYRYMIPAAGCFWLGFALCLNEILCKPEMITGSKGCIGTAKEELCKLKAIPRAAGIALTVLVIIIGLRDYRAFMGEEEYKIRLMAETEAALAMIGPQDSVLYNFDQVQAVTGYYLPGTTARFLWQTEGEELIQKITSPCGTVADAEEIRELLRAQEGEERSVWFIGSFNSREDIVEEWREEGLNVEEKGSFLLERYWFNLYKIS